jgi:hypothetical protein
MRLHQSIHYIVAFASNFSAIVRMSTRYCYVFVYMEHFSVTNWTQEFNETDLNMLIGLVKLVRLCERSRCLLLLRIQWTIGLVVFTRRSSS